MPNTSLNPQVVDLINQVQHAVMGPQVVLTSGAGKAYQSVAQTSAIAVQDAADALRNISTIATTAAGVAMAQLMLPANKPNTEQYTNVLQEAQKMMTSAVGDFSAISNAAANLVKQFPSG